MKNILIKRALCLIVALFTFLGVLTLFPMGTAAEEPEQPGSVLEAGSWDDLRDCLGTVNGSYCYSHGPVTIKLTDDLRANAADYPQNTSTLVNLTVQVGAVVTLDFNGHKMICTDTASTSNLEAELQDFVVIRVDNAKLTLDDSVGGGGVFMTSKRAIDSAIAALRVRSYAWREPDPYGETKLTINGGTYSLDAECTKFGLGTNQENNSWKNYRGTVIADMIATEINGGKFIAKSNGIVVDGEDFCARELTAFGTTIVDFADATAPYDWAVEHGVEDPRVQCHTVINGGYFVSDGYALHSFEQNLDNLYNNLPHRLDSYSYVNYPEIYGGRFEGGVDFTGLTFTYSNGNEELNPRPASQIVKGSTVYGKKGNGSTFTDVSDMTWRDLHKIRSMVVLDRTALALTTEPTDGTSLFGMRRLTRSQFDRDTYSVSYVTPSWFGDAEIVSQPTIAYKALDSDVWTTHQRSRYELSYASYLSSGGLNVKAGAVFYVGQFPDYYATLEMFKSYRVSVLQGFEAINGIPHCSIEQVNGGPIAGRDFKFRVVPKEDYEIVDPSDFHIYAAVEGDPFEVTSDAQGVYTVPNVTDNVYISAGGNGLKGVSRLNVTMGDEGETYTFKYHVGDSVTLKDPRHYGLDYPNDWGFQYWKLGNSSTQYQPGDVIECTWVGDKTLRASFSGLYGVTVHGGKAYLDAEHTQRVFCTAAETVVYLLPDPLPENDPHVFQYWGIDAGRIYNSWFDGENCLNQYEGRIQLDYSDVELSPVYALEVRNVTVAGFRTPAIGEAIEKYAYTESVTSEGARWSYYDDWKDVTDPENPVSLQNGDLFEEGHAYEVSFAVATKGGQAEKYVFPEDLGIALTLDGSDPSSYQVTGREFTNSYHEYVRFTLRFAPLCVTYSVSGAVNAVGDEDAAGSVFLVHEGEDTPAFRTAFTGNSGSYAFEGVTPGAYTLIAVKDGCAAFSAPITVENGDVVFDLTLTAAGLFGDLNGDGKTDISDVTALLDALSTGAILPSFDLNTDGSVDISDVTTLLDFLAGN